MKDELARRNVWCLGSGLDPLSAIVYRSLGGNVRLVRKTCSKCGGSGKVREDYREEETVDCESQIQDPDVDLLFLRL